MDELSMKSMVQYNLSVALADVIDSLMIDFEAELNKTGKALKHMYKQRFNIMKSNAKSFHMSVDQVRKDGYVISQKDSFMEDADWLYDILLLIIDRVGDRQDKMDSLKAMIMNIDSELKILNK